MFEDVKKRRSILTMNTARQNEKTLFWDRVDAWYCSDDPDAIDQGTQSFNGFIRDRDGEDEFDIDTNYLYAFIDTMTAVIMPTIPQLNIKANKDDFEDPALARESLVNDTWRRAKLQLRLRRSSMFATLHGESFVKTVWRSAIACPVYNVLSCRNIMWDQSVPWEETRYVIEAVPYTKEEFEAEVEKGSFKLIDGKMPAFDQIPVWINADSSNGTSSAYTRQTRDSIERVIVYEFHDLVADKVYWMLEGQEEDLAELEKPYKYIKNPYCRLYFNESPRHNGGLADAKLIFTQQEKLNQIDLLEMNHTFMTIPKMVVDENATDDPEEVISQLQVATNPGDIVRAKMKESRPIQELLSYTAMPSQMPGFDRMRDRVKGQINDTLSLASYQRGDTSGDSGELATKVALADSSIRNRNGARTALARDFQREIGKNTLALWREYFPENAEFTLPGRQQHTEVLIDRLSLAFGPPGEELTDAEMFAEEWYYTYEVSAASPAEDDKAMRLKQLVSLAPLLLQIGADKQALLEETASLLDMKKLVPKNPPPPMQLPQGGLPGQPGVEGSPGQPPIGGALPGPLDQRHEAALPPQLGQSASPPALEV